MHTLLLRSEPYRVDGGKYIDRVLFTALKQSWDHGHTDFQVPRHSPRSLGVLTYVLKYLSKNGASKRLWQKLYGGASSSTDPLLAALFNKPDDNPDIDYSMVPQYAAWKVVLVPDQHKVLYCTLKERKIKLLTWSRNFVPAYLSGLRIS